MKTIVFIVGLGHSGSTVLGMALGSFNKSFHMGEIQQLPLEIQNNTPCVCGELIQDCPFWEKIRNDIQDEYQIDFKTDSDSFSLKEKKINDMVKNYRLRRVLDVFGRQTNHDEWKTNSKILYDSIFKNSGSDVIVDSSKDIHRAFLLKRYLQGLYQIKFIHLIRDCRGLVHSYKKKTYSVQYPGKKGKKVLPRTVTSPEKTIHIWKRSYLKTTILLSAFVPKRDWRIVKFEDFCNRPEETFIKLADWLDLTYNQDVVNYGNCVHHNVGGNSSRFNSSKIRPTTDSWKKTLTDDEIRLFYRKARLINWFYGYRNNRNYEFFL